MGISGWSEAEGSIRGRGSTTLHQDFLQECQRGGFSNLPPLTPRSVRISRIHDGAYTFVASAPWWVGPAKHEISLPELHVKSLPPTPYGRVAVSWKLGAPLPPWESLTTCKSHREFRYPQRRAQKARNRSAWTHSLKKIVNIFIFNICI